MSSQNTLIILVHSLMSGFIRLPTEGYTQGGRFWVRMRRDQELEGADNTRFRQVQAANMRNALRPV
jgi:hypothetical protein